MSQQHSMLRKGWVAIGENDPAVKFQRSQNSLNHKQAGLVALRGTSPSLIDESDHSGSTGRGRREECGSKRDQCAQPQQALLQSNWYHCIDRMGLQHITCLQGLARARSICPSQARLELQR